MNNSPQSVVDTIVVGAGVSGMAAAYRLDAAGVGVTVLEADARVGGRTWSLPDAPGGPVDLGGMYIGETHTHSRELGLSLGLKPTPAKARGSDVYLVDGTVLLAPGGCLDESLPFVHAHGESLDALDALAARVGSSAPWDTVDAAQLDSRTVADWIESSVCDPVSRSLHEHAVRSVLGADPGEVSLLYWAFYIDQCEGIKTLLATRGGAQNEWWIGGAGQLTERIADRLGSAVRTRWPVSAVRCNGSDGFEVVRSDGLTLRAWRVILALPPADAGRITFAPALPRSRRQLQMRTPMGRFSKIVLRYDRPFWEDRDLSGCITDLDDTGAVVFPGTKLGESSGTLICFIGGRSQDLFESLAPPAKQQRLTRMLVRGLGQEASEPFYWHETDWSAQAWVQGGPVAYMPPGVLSAFGSSLRSPVGSLLFAGTEAAPQWTGYMEGAVRAGHIAADTVVRDLGTS